MSEPAGSPRETFILRLRRELHRRAGGRVTALEIGEKGGAISVSCRVPSYHVKQLVIVAVLTSLPPKEGHDVLLDVRVGTAAPLAEGSGDDGAWDGPGRVSASGR
ncbi:MAG TPA: hypothetical protein VFW33_08980 [Gemmataceae bacterium]|nr:hypothetical protein [Gemmataceae bacterium]